MDFGKGRDGGLGSSLIPAQVFNRGAAGFQVLSGRDRF
jgi:hypothetical protein